jgi:hypothetical protein
LVFRRNRLKFSDGKRGFLSKERSSSMSDIVFDASEQVTVLCTNLNVQGHDLLLDSVQRRRVNGPRFRRALVDDQNDGLTMNFGSDYPGGVTVDGMVKLTGDVEMRDFLARRPPRERQ